VKWMPLNGTFGFNAA